MCATFPAYLYNNSFISCCEWNVIVTLNSKLSTGLVHSISNAAKGWVNDLQTSVPSILQAKLDSKIDEVKDKIERSAGIEKPRKKRKRRHRQ